MFYSDDVELNWSLDDFGPIVIPFSGMTVKLTCPSYNLKMSLLEERDGQGFTPFDTSNREMTHYTFQQNYYFMLGDNRHNSHDSRHFGPVPESAILGIATRVLYSKHGGCYGGSTISFRSACAKSESGTIDCNAHASNCPS